MNLTINKKCLPDLWNHISCQNTWKQQGTRENSGSRHDYWLKHLWQFQIIDIKEQLYGNVIIEEKTTRAIKPLDSFRILYTLSCVAPSFDFVVSKQTWVFLSLATGWRKNSKLYSNLRRTSFSIHNYMHNTIRSLNSNETWGFEDTTTNQKESNYLQEKRNVWHQHKYKTERFPQ